jgi:anti-anti-sigma regulatory factor
MLSTPEIHERRESDAVVLALQGELTELEFIDSGGKGVLHRAAIRAGEGGWTLDLTGPRPNVRRALALTNLA